MISCEEALPGLNRLKSPQKLPFFVAGLFKV